MTAAVMTMLSEGESCVSDAGTPAEEQASVVSGIFGTVLSACQIRVVGPTGREKVIDLQHRVFLPLWLYLVVRTFAGGWVSVGDILRDVYGYRGWVNNVKTGQREDPKESLLNNFHQQRFALSKEINKALVEVGLPQTNLFRNERGKKTFFWGIADTIEFQDLSHFEECRTLITEAKKSHADEEAYRAQVKAACEGFCATIGNPLALLAVDETHEPWIRKMVQDVFSTYYNALKCLAAQANAEAKKTSDEEAKRSRERQEAQYWTTYALSCVSTAGTLFKGRGTLISNGEMALRKTLIRCIHLNDRERAITVYQEFKDLVENGDKVWKPEAKTKDIWQKVLTMNEDEVV
jgi:hypothetical protein